MVRKQQMEAFFPLIHLEILNIKIIQFETKWPYTYFPS